MGVFAIPIFDSCASAAPDGDRLQDMRCVTASPRCGARFATCADIGPVVLFLLAYWMYIDGVNTIMKMAVDYGLALGFTVESDSGDPDDPIHRLPGHAAVRLARQRISPVVGIFIGIAVYTRSRFTRVLMTRHASSSSWPPRSVACRAEFRHESLLLRSTGAP